MPFDLHAVLAFVLRRHHFLHSALVAEFNSKLVKYLHSNRFIVFTMKSAKLDSPLQFTMINSDQKHFSKSSSFSLLLALESLEIVKFKEKLFLVS